MTPNQPALTVVLVNVRSAYNVGSIFRTCESAGVNQLALIGYTPTPLEPKLEKTALGALHQVPWIHFCDPLSTIHHFHHAHQKIIACEPIPSAQSLYTYNFPTQTCLLFGNEVTGLSKAVIAQADMVIKIPQFGHKESLNIATAAGILIYEWRRQFLPT